MTWGGESGLVYELYKASSMRKVREHDILLFYVA